MRGVAFAAGQVVQAEHGLVGMARRDDIGAHLDEHLGELPLEPLVGAPLIDPFAEVPAVRGIVQTTGERLDGRLQPGAARAGGAPLLCEGCQSLPVTRPQILPGQLCHHPVAQFPRDVRAVQIHAAGGPGAQMLPQVRHVVPEMCADRAVEVQFGEPDAAVRSGPRGDLRQAFGEILALEQREFLGRGPGGAQQQLGRVVNDVGVCAVEHGHGDEEGPLRALPLVRDESGDLVSPVRPGPERRCAPLRESVALPPRLTGPPDQVGEVRDLPHRPALAEEAVHGGIGL